MNGPAILLRRSNMTRQRRILFEQLEDRSLLATLIADVSASSSANPSMYLQPVTFSAHVIPRPQFPFQTFPSVSGTVTFLDGNTSLGSVRLLTVSPAEPGFVSLSVSTLSIGDHIITAAYSGDFNYA